MSTIDDRQAEVRQDALHGLPLGHDREDAEPARDGYAGEALDAPCKLDRGDPASGRSAGRPRHRSPAQHMEMQVEDREDRRP